MINSKIQAHKKFSTLVEGAFHRFEPDLDRLPRLPFHGSPVDSPSEMWIGKVCRYPEGKGKNPRMSALFRIHNTLIAVMSKNADTRQTFLPTHLADIWGPSMGRYCKIRDDLHNNNRRFNHLNAQRLVKYAFGLVTYSREIGCSTTVLVYLYPEPLSWPGKSRMPSAPAEHLQEIQQFAQLVDGDEVKFQPLAFKELLQSWEMAGDSEVQQLANAIMGAHPPLA